MNVNEEMLAGYADTDAGYADPDATLFEYRLCWYWFMYKNYVPVLLIMAILF